VTALLEAPLTVAWNASVWHASTAALPGEIVTATGDGGGGAGGAVTVAAATADAVGSATLVAMTWQLAAAPGAVYRPDAAMLPQPVGSRRDQVTAPFFAPLTRAVKATVPPAGTVTAAGETATATRPGFTLEAEV
jgi:hypothetical protein